MPMIGRADATAWRSLCTQCPGFTYHITTVAGCCPCYLHTPTCIPVQGCTSLLADPSHSFAARTAKRGSQSVTVREQA